MDEPHGPVALMDERSWVVIAGGGTAGHLLPGLAVARALVARGHDASSIHFVGSDRGVEARLVPDAGFTLDELPGRGIQRRLTAANVGAAIGILRAVARASLIVRRRRPAVVVVLGGYASLGCGLGAVMSRVPLVLLEQNVRAGAVNRVLRWSAAAAAVSFDGTDLRRAVTTGNPLRPEITAAAAHPDRDAARRALGLVTDRQVLAVFSGSLGSRRINDAARGLVERWADRSDLAVYHVIGRRDWASFRAAAPEPAPEGLLYRCVEYEDRMDLLLQAADLAVSRAGGTVAELAAFGLPAVLVPLPIAPRDHQTANAQVLVDAGAAVLVPDQECTSDRLLGEVGALLADGERLGSMSRAMAGQAHVDAADAVAALVEAQARA